MADRSSWVLRATGITCKAFGVDLRCPVTLKVTRERYVVMSRFGFVPIISIQRDYENDS
jgi:hypothetical protein